MNKEEHFKKIMQLYSDAADLQSEAEKLGSQFTDLYAGFKPGDRVVIKPEYGQQENGIIRRVTFDNHSQLQGLAKLTVEPYKNDWSERKSRRSNIYINQKSEIIDHIPAHTQPQI